MTGRDGPELPPRRTREWLARRLPPGTVGASMMADLDQEFAERPAGAARRWWYRREAVRLAFAYSGAPEEGRGGMERFTGWIGFALRRLRRDPGFAVLSIGTMGLGIGATVSIFTVVNAVVLEPLPYEEPDRLVAVFEEHAPRGTTRNVGNPGNLLALESGVPAIEALAGIVLTQSTVIQVDDRVEEVPTQYVTPDFFEVLGVEMEVGAGFSETATMAQPEIILAHDFWRQEFGADPGVIGRTIVVNGESVTITGVLPRTFVVFEDGASFFTSITMAETGDQTSTGRFLYGVARLAPDAELALAQEQASAVFEGLVEAYPDFNAGWSVALEPVTDYVVGDTQRGLWILLGAVGMLLLIACANVANLFLSRATERRREMAVRTSLGATGGVLARQLLGEALVLALAGGALGVGLAWAGTEVLASRMPAAFALPRVEQAGVDATVLLFALALSVATGVLFALVPALQVNRTDPGSTLNAEARGASRVTGRLRNGLIVAEVALSMVLLVGAGLTTRGFVSLIQRDIGMETDGVLTARVNLVGRGAEERVDFFERLVADLDARSSIEAAGAVTFLPLLSWGAATSFHDYDDVPESRDQWPTADMRNVSGRYFEAMGIRLLEGRTFDPAVDVDGAAPVIVVNRALADDLWPGEEALGRRLAISWGPIEEPWEVVGVVEDVPQRDLDEAPRAKIYHAYGQSAHFPWMHLAVRGNGGATSLLPEIESVIAELDPTVPVSQVRTMEDIVRTSVARPRMTAALMVVFGGLAALLAAIGLYGVLSWTVTRRVREIGVRMAIGADGGRVLRMVVAQGMILVGVGLVLGTGAAMAAGRVLESLLFGLASTDPLTFGGAGLLLGGVAFAACLIPAWRATRVPPADALRES